MSHQSLSPRHALALLGVVAFAWGTNWPITKMIVREATPLWATALRCAIAASVLAAVLSLRRELIIPRRGDVPVILSISLLHMTAFSALIAFGLQELSAGRAIVLGYTTPIWVTLGARIFLSETVTLRQTIGVCVGLAGLAVIFNPATLDWGDRRALAGSGMILLAAFCWAANIVYVRAHKWVSSPFQLLFWQVLLAGAVLSALAAIADGFPHIAWTPRLVTLLLVSAIVNTVLAHWAITLVTRSLPAVTTSLGLLATPAVGIVSGIAMLDEPFEPALVAALALIVGGIAIGTVNRNRPSSDGAP